MAHQNTKCLGVSITDKGVKWGCNHCGWTAGGYYNGSGNANGHAHREVYSAFYDYADEGGNLLFQVCRRADKASFPQRKPDGKGGWIWKASDVRKVLYRLPELIEAVAGEHTVLIVEGEKDVENLRKLNMPATCNPGGASEPGQQSKWKAVYSEFLRGADIVVVPDNDDPGRAHAETIVRMSAGIAKRIRILDLTQHWSDCPKGGDISDWLAAGGSVERLTEIIDALPEVATTVDNASSAPPVVERIFSAAALQIMTFPPLKFILPDLVPEGATLLVSRPKLGKSWLVLDIAIATAADRFTLGTLKPSAGDVLYLALEDGKRRLQRRITKVLPTFSITWPDNLKMATEWPRADQGGLADIERWLQAHPNARLVIVDTLAQFRKLSTGKGQLYPEDYAAISGLQKLASKYNVGIILVHHDRKSEADDIFDTVSGTLGLTGAADTILIMKRQAGAVTLYVRGRDIEEAEMAMQFDKSSCRWSILGTAAEVHRSSERAAVLKALETAGVDGLSVAEIMTATGSQNRHAMDSLLFKMLEAGEITRPKRGLYSIPQGNRKSHQSQRPLNNPLRSEDVENKEENPNHNDHNDHNATSDPSGLPERSQKPVVIGVMLRNGGQNAENKEENSNLPITTPFPTPLRSPSTLPKGCGQPAIDPWEGLDIPPYLRREPLGPPAISAGPDDDLGDLE
jgi:hypothetical protein